jgi:hypothetical protein
MTSSFCPLIYYILSEAVNFTFPVDNTQGLTNTNTNTSQRTYDIAKNLLPSAVTLLNIPSTLPFEDLFMRENMLTKGFVNHADL